MTPRMINHVDTFKLACKENYPFVLHYGLITSINGPISYVKWELIATEYLIITQIIDDLNLSLNQTILNLLIEPHKLIYTLQSMVLFVYSNKTKFGIYTKQWITDQITSV